MRLDHVSYVTAHDQLADTVQRLGSRLETTFVDGGIHPRFGTRNFTAPLVGGQYVEVVCPLDHPATERTPWGKAVTQKAAEGGGWLTWVFSTSDITTVEEKFGRNATDGHRTLPDGSELQWKQIGVQEIATSRNLPFYIQWLTSNHPSQQGTAKSKIVEINILDEKQLADSWLKSEIVEALGDIQLEWTSSNSNESREAIISVSFLTPNGITEID